MPDLAFKLGASRATGASFPADGRTYILHGHARSYFWEGEGTLSIKTFFGGSALYDAGGGRFAVEEGRYLVLNHGRRYAITVDAAEPVESVVVFFEAGFAEDVHRALASSASSLVDDPYGPCPADSGFFERTYPPDDLVRPALVALRGALRGALRLDAASKGWFEEHLHATMERLLAAHGRARREASALAAARPSTREELYRRLHRARDYAEASLAERLTVAELASVACLSPNHFLRTFRQAFGASPHQFLVRRRLERARRLLDETDLPVTDVCLAVGFESLGSFSWLFRRRTGCSPEQFRRRKR